LAGTEDSARQPRRGTGRLAAAALLAAIAVVALLAAATLAAGAATWWLRLDAAGVAGADAARALPLALVAESGLTTVAPPLALAATGVLALVVVGRSRPRARRAATLGTAFAAIALAGTAVEIARTALWPRLEPTAVRLAGDDGDLAGLRVGTAAGRTYLVATPSDDARAALDGEPAARLVAVRDGAVATSVTLAATRVDGDRAPAAAGTALATLRRSIDSSPPRTVSTSDPARAFAPLVVLHARERRPPLGADDFVDNSVLSWWKDQFCDDEHFAVGRAHPDSDRRPLPAIDVDRLGGRDTPYRNVPATPGCGDSPRVPVPSTAHTRPWDVKRERRLGIKEGFYLDLDDDYRGPPPLTGDAPPIVAGVPAYWEAEPERVGDRPGLRLTYWLLFTSSYPPIDERLDFHFTREGDWERVSVLLRRGGSPDRLVPVSVRYHYYDRHRDVPWSQALRVRRGAEDAATHPVAFTALGSHASYWAPGRYRVRLGHEDSDFYGEEHMPWIVDRASACGECPRWRTWDALASARRQAWYGFGGAWGTPNGASRNTGALGPSRYMRAGEGTRMVYSIGPDPPRREASGWVEVLE
jgi:hypothetical protein